MKYKEYLKKSEIFANEAQVDIDNACYNKAVSALWFMIEALFRAILNYYKQSMPSKSGAVIAKTISFIREWKVNKRDLEELGIASTLYTLRNEIDHKRTIATKTSVRSALSCAIRILQALRKLLHRKAPDIVQTIGNLVLVLSRIDI